MQRLCHICSLPTHDLSWISHSWTEPGDGEGVFRPKGTCPQQEWTQEVKLPFLAPSLLPRSHFQHLIVCKAYSSPLFYLLLIRSCTQEGKVTNSILQVEKLRHRKEKKKLRSWSKKKKRKKIISCWIHFTSFSSLPHSPSNTPSHPPGLLHLPSWHSLFRQEEEESWAFWSINSSAGCTAIMKCKFLIEYRTES